MIIIRQNPWSLVSDAHAQRERESILTESPPFAGGRNLIGGTRTVSKKNMEWPALFPCP